MKKSILYIQWYDKQSNGKLTASNGVNGRTDIIGNYRLSEIHWLAISDPKADRFAGYAICSKSVSRQLTDVIEFVHGPRTMHKATNNSVYKDWNRK